LDQLYTNTTLAGNFWQDYVTKRTGPYASIPGPTVAFLPYQAFIAPAKWASLLKGLDKELLKYKGTPFEKQFAVQRKLLEDKTVAQVE
jgi:hypothetical protein